MRKRIWILCCLLAVLLAACGEQPKEPVQPQPPAVTEEPEDPEQHVVKAPKKEDQEQPAPDTGYLAELEVHCGQYEGMYHLWVETDQESMKALTPQQYKNYAFGMENKLLPEQAAALVRRLAAEGQPLSEAAKQVAKETGYRKGDLYRLALENE